MENENMEMPSYWPPVIVGALFVGLVGSVMAIVGQYMVVNSEPTGASFTPGQAVQTFSCLIAAFGGFIAVRQYAKDNEITFKIGKGATIGVLVGIVGTVFSTIISLIWYYVVDTNLSQNAYDWAVRNLEAQNLPQEQFDMALGFIPEPGSITPILIGVGIGLVMYGVLNLITGIIAAKVFASED